MSDKLLNNAAFLQNIFDAMPTSVFIVDSDVRITNVNAAASRIFDMDRNAFVLKRGGEVLNCVNADNNIGGCGRSVHCSDCVLRNSVRKASEGRKVFREVTSMLLKKDGREQEAHFMVTAVSIPYAGEDRILLTLEDITGLRKAEKALELTVTKLQNITSVLGEGVYVLDADGRVTFMNPESERLLGWTQEELLGKNIHEIIHFQKADGTHIPASECPVLMSIRSNACYRVPEDVFTRKDGTVIPVSFVSTPIVDAGRVTGSVAAFHDITGRKQAQEALRKANELLEYRATTDILTKVYNRLKFNEVLAGEIQRAERHRTSLSVIMFDIDHFKRINDTYGHHAGDSVLVETAELITSHMRKYDSFARWGGEEFIILAPETGLDQAVQLAERLRTSMEGFNFSVAGRVTCSFGVAEMVTGDGLDSLTRRVDEAMYKAKNSGRNKVVAA